MIKTFIVVVLLAGVNQFTGKKDLMVFPEPKFDTVEQCIEFVKENKDPFFYRTWEHYGFRPIEQVYCAPEQKALDLLKPEQPIEIPKLPGLET